MKTNGLITRRRAIVAGLASFGGLLFARSPNDLPPTYGNLLRLGDTVTYAAHRALLPRQSLVKECTLADITSFPATGTTDPGAGGHLPLGGAYRELKAGAFAGWRLPVEGLVARPAAFSLNGWAWYTGI
jgi:hypothetical protein